MMTHLYDSPKKGTDTRVFTGEDGVTERMVTGVYRARKWARIMGGISFIYALGLVVWLVMMVSSWAEVGIRGVYNEIGDGMDFDLFALFVELSILAVLVCAFFLVCKGQALFRYAEACQNLSEQSTFSDLAQCYAIFGQCQKYACFVSMSFCVFMLLEFFL